MPTLPRRLEPLQLRKLLHQLFYAEPLKLYRNLGIFSVALTTEDRTLSIFRMSNPLSIAQFGTGLCFGPLRAG